MLGLLPKVNFIRDLGTSVSYRVSSERLETPETTTSWRFLKIQWLMTILSLALTYVLSKTMFRIWYYEEVVLYNQISPVALETEMPEKRTPIKIVYQILEH